MDKEKAIDSLKSKVEEKQGWKLATPSDFNHLILRMQEETGKTLALSTLKRVLPRGVHRERNVPGGGIP